jgi:hypothetical protein
LICTSKSLQTSTRVSSGFVLPRHSSPSFGYQRVRYNSAKSTISEIGGLLLRLTVTTNAITWHEDRNSINFTFIVPPWPIQDRATRAHVRLLGPCFKTGQVDTDLLAIDCSSTHRYCRQRPTSKAAFPYKVQKERPNRHRLDNKTVRTHYSKPHISGEIEPISTLSAYSVHRPRTITQAYIRRHILIPFRGHRIRTH